MPSTTVRPPDVAQERRDASCSCTPFADHMGEQEAETLVIQLKALAHPVRLRMVDLIHAHGGELCVCEFENHFDVKQPTISHHLKVLRKAGLIHSRQEGSWVHHFVEEAAFRHLRDLMDGFALVPAVP